MKFFAKYLTMDSVELSKHAKISSIAELYLFLKRFFQGYEVKIYLFGSRSDGTATKGSDLDLGFLSSQDIAAELAMLGYILEESNLPVRVDLVNLSEVDDSFKQRVTARKYLWIELLSE